MFYLKIKYGFLILILNTISIIVNSQNLVPNASFEIYFNCPENYTEYASEKILKDWYIPTLGTPDYFNKCSKLSGVPLNWAGQSEAFSGNGYIGLITRRYFQNEHSEITREYLQVKLKERLKKDSLYVVKFYAKAATSAVFVTDALGIHISNNPIQQKTWSNLHLNPQIRNLQNRIMNNKSNWTEICAIYRAKGEEEYITIGNFENNSNTNYEKAPPDYDYFGKLNFIAYYYIDNVSLIPISDTSNCFCKEVVFDNLARLFIDRFYYSRKKFNGIIRYGEAMILDKVFFSFDKSNLSPNSHNILDTLFSSIQKEDWKSLDIFGYTDNLGSSEYNRKLSLIRAESVRNYLINKGIDKQKIKAYGKGNSNPISTLQSEDGRILNRRVEIVINKNP